MNQSVTKHFIDNSGYEYWKNEKGQYHREGDGPAIIYPDGSEKWDKNGYLHRDKNPAIVRVYGYQI